MEPRWLLIRPSRCVVSATIPHFLRDGGMCGNGVLNFFELDLGLLRDQHKENDEQKGDVNHGSHLEPGLCIIWKFKLHRLFPLKI